MRLALGSIALAVAPGVSGVLAARALGPEGRGELAVLLALGTLGGSIGLRGYDTALLARPDPDALSARLQLARRRCLLVVPIEGALAAFVAIGVLGSSKLLPGLLACVLAASTVLFLLTRAANLSADRGSVVLASDLTSAIVLLACSALVFLAAGGPAFFVVAAVIGLIAGSLVGSVVPESETGGSLQRLGARGELGRDLDEIGRPALLARSFQAAAFRLDRVVLAALAGASAVGIYAAVVPFAEMATIVPLHLSMLVTREMAADPKQQPWHAYRPARVALALAVSSTLVVLLVAERLIEVVYGEQYTEGTSALRILAVASFVSVVWRLVESGLFARGPASGAVMASLVAAVLAVGFTAFLADWGATGAATASLIGYSAAFVVSTLFARTVRRA
jgi:Membrane protein involved in the export of O-antigen and teichoic acid